MASLLTKVGLTLVILVAILYQTVLRDAIFNTYGYGRQMDSVSKFPYRCRRIADDAMLRACEDMWLDQPSRTLLLACSDPDSRTKWLPNIGLLDASARPLTDHVVAMSIDKPKGKSYEYTVLAKPGFAGVHGDGTFNVLGMIGRSFANGGGAHLYLVNNRPSIDYETGELLDNTKVGANSTIEMFEWQAGSSSLKHLKTFADPEIATPNNIALAEDGGFYFTNDHGSNKVGLSFELSTLLGTGTVSYCPADQQYPGKPCKTVARRFPASQFPNGLLRSHTDGLLYVPSAAAGGVTVFAIEPADASLKQVQHIKVPYPIDNLAQDAEGDIYVPAFPKMTEMMASFKDAWGPRGQSVVFRLRRSPNGNVDLTKIIEDAGQEVLPGSTAVVHDAATGRLFLSGVISPFITVCEKI